MYHFDIRQIDVGALEMGELDLGFPFIAQGAIAIL